MRTTPLALQHVSKLQAHMHDSRPTAMADLQWQHAMNSINSSQFFTSIAAAMHIKHLLQQQPHGSHQQRSLRCCAITALRQAVCCSMFALMRAWMWAGSGSGLLGGTDSSAAGGEVGDSTAITAGGVAGVLVGEQCDWKRNHMLW
jgi:hypothetical protein